MGGFSTYQGRLLRLLVKRNYKKLNLTKVSESLPIRPHFLRDLSKAEVNSQFIVELSSNLRLNRDQFVDAKNYK